LTVALTITLVGKTAGFYGLDFIARPVETKYFQRVFNRAPATAPQAA
jgi:hypothetical protein